MASVTGGQYLFTNPTQTITLGINNGSSIFPGPVSGDLNIEVFTAVGVSTTNPPPLDAGFQAEIVDPGGTIENGLLTGNTITLFGGNYQIQDEAALGGGRDLITLGSGNQTVVGAGGDTIIGGSGNQEINAALQEAAGPETIVGGSGNAAIFGGVGDSITMGAGAQYVDGTAGGMTIVVGSGNDIIVGGPADTLLGGAGTVDVQALVAGDIVNFSGQSGNASINATAGDIAVTLGSGFAEVFGGVGDTITAGSGKQYIDGTAGGMLLAAGTGSDTIFGSSVSGTPDTITGGPGTLRLLGLGSGDDVDLAAQSGAATVNAALGGPTDVSITLGNGSAIVFANTGDTIAFGSGNQYADGTAGNMLLEVGGNGGNDLIVGSTTPGAHDTITGGAANAILQSLGSGDVVNFAAQSGAAAINASAGDIAVTLGSGVAFVFGGVGDTVTFGSTGQYADGAPGGMTIGGGTGGVDSVFGSAISGGGDSISGGGGGLDFNLGGNAATSVAGGGDTINLTTGTGTATINAFSFEGQDQISNDSIIAGSASDSVFAGGGDTVGIGGNSTVSGTYTWSHADGNQTVGSVAFGTFDTLSGTTYDTKNDTFTTIAGGSGANVTIGGAPGTGLGDFQPATAAGATGDTLFYQGESTAIDAKIVVTAQSTTIGGIASSVIALPDGTTMTLVGVTTAELTAANNAGLLFK